MKNKLRIAVIGLKQHAGIHIRYLQNNPKVELTKVYYHKLLPQGFDELPLTSSLEECMESDCIIISTPTGKHFEHLQLIKEYSGYILLEKPAVNTTEQINSLLSFPTDLKKWIKVNFNFQFQVASISYFQFQFPISKVLQLFQVLAMHELSHDLWFPKRWMNIIMGINIIT